MAKIFVKFTYLTGVKEKLFTNARLHGNWDENGRCSDIWSITSMREITGEDGCPAFCLNVEFDAGQINQEFRWGVSFDTGSAKDVWGIMSEVNAAESRDQIRSFRLSDTGSNEMQEINYYLNESRRLGAQKYYKAGADAPGIRFAVWAPNAQRVQTVMSYVWNDYDFKRKPSCDLNKRPAIQSLPRSDIAGGYIADDGAGSHPDWGPFEMTRQEDEIWVSDVDDPELADFAKFDHSPYMYKITKDNGSVVYRTDLYSRCQIGFGDYRPSGKFLGNVGDLDGTISCSVIVDPDKITANFHEPIWPEINWADQGEFWNSPEHRAAANIPRRVEDLVIYELHVGALGFGKSSNKPGTLKNCLDFLDYLSELGINTIELLPMSEFGGGVGGWGYATSHYFAIEYSGGGRDNYKWFVRECHERGIAVMLDVVYNHYNHNAERAEWMYDTNQHDKNCYYWYEGLPGDYPGFNNAVEENRKGTGGYIDNMSTAWAPRYCEERVRKMFISSAVALIKEFNIDGLRVDQTTSIHAYNRLHADGREVGSANIFGQKLLRELTRTLKLVKPDIMIIAEDHSNWDMVITPIQKDGMGFDAVWYADFYHHLVGDTDKGSDYAKLIKTAGYGDDRPLAMNYFAAALNASGWQKVVYHESHDEAGNGKGTDRLVNVAVNGSALNGNTRRYAEARSRFAAGITLLSAGTPLFLFGDEVCAVKQFLYGKVMENREDYVGLKNGSGHASFEYYRTLINLRLSKQGLRSRNIEIIYVNNNDRLLAFRRWNDREEYLVISSLNNHHFTSPGYSINGNIGNGIWHEIFNSDSHQFGGDNIGNSNGDIVSRDGLFTCAVPANGVVVFER